ncbi:MAG: hypothetical protein ACOXZO_11065 [Bacteroidales bacterium]
MYLLWGVIFPGWYPGYWGMTPPVSVKIRHFSFEGCFSGNSGPPGDDDGNNTIQPWRLAIY